MPWKECHVMDERMRFVARLLDGEKMAGLCEEFGISRKTGYKIYDRYKETGLVGLTDRSRRPHRHANQLPLAVEKMIVRLKKDYPKWGAPKLQERLKVRWPEVACPAISTVHAVLDRHGLVRRRRRRIRPRLTGTRLTQPTTPNALWCADYKGEFLLTNRRYCYPLTITDFATRYLIACEAQSTTKERYAFSVFERAFQDYGLPAAIRTDNGVPFASAHALYGLSKLAVWWLRLGITLERIAPGHPEQNGRHERLHLTLKTEATHPAAPNLQQQARFDTFVERFNHERPHQALDMKTPASLYVPSGRPYCGLEELEYPGHDWRAVITTCGRICCQPRKINVSQVFAGQRVGVKQVDEHIWLVTFMHYDLGYFDDQTCRLEPIDNPFGPKLLPMSPE